MVVTAVHRVGGTSIIVDEGRGHWVYYEPVPPPPRYWHHEHWHEGPPPGYWRDGPPGTGVMALLDTGAKVRLRAAGNESLMS